MLNRLDLSGEVARARALQGASGAHGMERLDWEIEQAWRSHRAPQNPHVAKARAEWRGRHIEAQDGRCAY